MTDQESVSLGNVIRKIYHALRTHTDAGRIYQVTLIDGLPPFHYWLVSYRKNDPERGMKFLMRGEISESVETLSALMS